MLNLSKKNFEEILFCPRKKSDVYGQETMSSLNTRKTVFTLCFQRSLRWYKNFVREISPRSNMPKRKVQTSIKDFSEDSDTDQKSNKKLKVNKEIFNNDNGTKFQKGSKTTDIKDKNIRTPFNRTETHFNAINFDCNKNSSDGKSWNFKISSWNVVSLKALSQKNGMDYVKHESPDVMCFQETKCNEKNLPEQAKLNEYHRYFASGEKAGYAGVALYSKTKPLNVKYGIGHKTYDNEGRVITAEYEKFFLVTAYVPNAGRELITLPKRLEWDPLFRSYLSKLNSEKPVILCGDLNVAHNEIDLKNPASNTRTAGFTREERDGFTELLNEGFIDTFRKLYPAKTGAYTYWSYRGNARSRNVGWRLDYFIISERLMPNICDSVIRSDVYGSDHCPITLFLSV